MRDEIAESVGWDSSLIPSYIMKTVLLSELFQTNRDLWEEEFKWQRIFQALELALQGVKTDKISSFFIARQNLLTGADHENKLRQCVLEDMLSQMVRVRNWRTHKLTPERGNNRSEFYK